MVREHSKENCRIHLCKEFALYEEISKSILDLEFRVAFLPWLPKSLHRVGLPSYSHRVAQIDAVFNLNNNNTTVL